ncbi:MAG: hypothetical protein ACP5F9_04685 [Thiomonas sp.]|jgi:hypothetical protein
MKSALIVSSFLLGACALALPAHADGPPVSIQLNIGNPPPPPPVYVAPPAYVPPPVVVSAPPTMIWLPEFGGYVALGVSQPLFYLGGVYYYYSGGRWFIGPGYAGPWRPAKRIPPGLRKFRDPDWRWAQERAYRYDKDPDWKRIHAVGPPPDRGPGHGHGPDHHGHGKGHGKGHDKD